MSTIAAIACVCEDTTGCEGGPDGACQPCAELHPMDPCLRHLRDDDPRTPAELLEHWAGVPEAALSPNRMYADLARLVTRTRAGAAE